MAQSSFSLDSLGLAECHGKWYERVKGDGEQRVLAWPGKRETGEDGKNGQVAGVCCVL